MLTGDDVAPCSQYVVSGHEPEGEEGEEDPGVSDQIRDEQEDIFSFSHFTERFLQLRHYEMPIPLQNYETHNKLKQNI